MHLGMGLGMGWMWIWTVAALALLAAAVWAVLASGRREGRSGDDSSPEAILARRYASGEIDEEEYRRRLSELRGEPASAGGRTRRRP